RLSSTDNQDFQKTGASRLHASPHKSQRTARRVISLEREPPLPFVPDVVPLCGSEPSHQASAADGAGAHWRLADCVIGSVSGWVLYPAPFCPGTRKRDDTRAKIDIIDTGSRSGFGKQARLSHAWDGVRFQHERIARVGKQHVNASVNNQAERAKS